MLKKLILLRFFKHSQKNLNFKIFEKDIVGIHMGSKATTTNFLFCPSFKYFFCLPHTQYAAKNPKPSKSGVNREKNSIFLQSLRHIPRWVRLVQKTRSKNSHAWASLKRSASEQNYLEEKNSIMSRFINAYLERCRGAKGYAHRGR